MTSPSTAAATPSTAAASPDQSIDTEEQRLQRDYPSPLAAGPLSSFTRPKRSLRSSATPPPAPSPTSSPSSPPHPSPPSPPTSSPSPPPPPPPRRCSTATPPTVSASSTPAVERGRRLRREELDIRAQCLPFTPQVIAAVRAVIDDDVDAFKAAISGSPQPPAPSSTRSSPPPFSSPPLLPLSPSAWVANSIVEGRRGQAASDPLGLDIPQPTTFLHLAGRYNAVRCLAHLLTGLHVDPNAVDSQRATALDDCALYGSCDAARLLVKLGCDPARASNQGATPLHTAAAEGQVEFVRLCCRELRLDLNRPCNEGWTPLVWALDAKESARLPTLAVLIDAGADVNCRDKANATPLMWAISSLQVPSDDVVKLLVRSRADLDAVNRQGKDAFGMERWDPKGLMVGPDGWADYRQRVKPPPVKQARKRKRGGSSAALTKKQKAKSPLAVRALEEKQEAATVDSEQEQSPGETITAVADGGAEVPSPNVDVDGPPSALNGEAKADDDGLVSGGAEPAVTDGDAKSGAGDEPPLPPLPSPLPFLPPSPPLTQLDRAEARVPLCWRHETRAGRGRRYLFQELLNRAVEEGDYGNVERVRSLLSDWHSAHSRHRMFPLEYDSSYPIGPMQIAVAFDNDDTAILQLLLAAHIDPNKKTAAGFLPIHAAANVGNPRCVRMLLEQGGCDPNMAEERDGYTALMMAADDVNGGEVVRVLLEREGIDVNRSDQHGNTALHWAVFKGNLSIAQQLVKRSGIDLHAINKWGNTAMHYALYRGWKNKDGVAVLEAMLDAGVDVHTPLNLQKLFSGQGTERGQLLRKLLDQRDLLTPPAPLVHLPLLPRLLPPSSFTPPPLLVPRRSVKKKAARAKAASSRSSSASDQLTGNGASADPFACRPVLYSMDDISGGLEPVKIPLVNHLDTEGLDFVYVRDCVGVGGSPLDRGMPSAEQQQSSALSNESKEGRAAALCFCLGGCVDPTVCSCLGYFPWEQQKDVRYLDRFLSGGVLSRPGLEGGSRRRGASSHPHGLPIASDASKTAPKPRYTRTSLSAAQPCSLVLESLAMEKRRRERTQQPPKETNSNGATSLTRLPSRTPATPLLDEMKDVKDVSSLVANVPLSNGVHCVDVDCSGGVKDDYAETTPPPAQLMLDLRSDVTPVQGVKSEDTAAPLLSAMDVHVVEDAPHSSTESNEVTPHSSIFPSSSRMGEAMKEAAQSVTLSAFAPPVTPTSASDVDGGLSPLSSVMESATNDSAPQSDQTPSDGSPLSTFSSSSLSSSPSLSLTPSSPSPSTSPLRLPTTLPVNGLRASSLPLHELSFLSECGPRCGCPSWCAARCTSGGVRLQLQVYKTQEKGWACRTLQPIRQGTFVTEYAGEVLEADEAERRLTEYDRAGVHYMFSLKGSRRCIDPVHIGNLGRLLNHSCNPNLQKLQVYQHCAPSQPLPTPRMVFVAKRHIARYEELCISYDYEEQDFPGGCLRCHCHAPRCRYNLV